MSNISSFIQNQKKTYNSIIIHELIIIILLILSLYIYISNFCVIYCSLSSLHILKIGSKTGNGKKINYKNFKPIDKLKFTHKNSLK